MHDQSVARRSAFRRVPGGWWLDAALVAGLVAVTLALIAETPVPHADVALARWCDAHRPYAAELAVDGLNRFGQGGPLALVTLGLAVWRARRRHSIRPVLVVVATYVLLNLVVGPIKIATDRVAPHSTAVAHPERLFAAADGMSYPSGHVVNAIVWYAAITIILGAVLPRWAWLALRTVPPVLIVATTTYLGYHWISDDVAGALVGVVVARLLLRVPWDTLPLGRTVARLGIDGPAGLAVPPATPQGNDQATVPSRDGGRA